MNKTAVLKALERTNMLTSGTLYERLLDCGCVAGELVMGTGVSPTNMLTEVFDHTFEGVWEMFSGELHRQYDMDGMELALLVWYNDHVAGDLPVPTGPEITQEERGRMMAMRAFVVDPTFEKWLARVREYGVYPDGSPVYPTTPSAEG